MEKFIPEIRFTAVDHDPFRGPTIERTVPTTEAQREVFVASLMGKEASCAYNESVTLQLKGVLDVEALRRSIAALTDRHEALRSCISADGMRVIVQEKAPAEMELIDLALTVPNAREIQLRTIANDDMSTPFDLLHGPILRVRLIKLGAEENLLRLTAHHVLVDGWSLGIMMADISKLYSGSELDAVVPFSEFALAVIDHTKTDDHARTEQYWLDQFKGNLPRLDLPTDKPRPKPKTYAGHRIDIELDEDITRKLKELATRSGASLVTTLLTCYEMLLHHITGQSDLVVGLPAAGQNDFGMKQLVGHCVNLLALRSRIDDERSFIEHLKERRTAILDSSDNQKYTFGTLVRKLKVPREAGRIPLCPVVFNVDMNMDDGVAFAGLEHRFTSNPRSFENFELFLNASGSEKHLVLEWSYNTDLFKEETVRGWMNDLRGIIERAHAAPSQRIATLISPSAAKSNAPLPPTAWSGAPTPYPQETMDALFDKMCDRYPDRIAVQLENTRVTYSELRKLSDALAAELVHRGLKQGEPVGLCLDRSIATQTAMLGILKAGGCYVPFDLSYPAERVRYMLDDAQPRFMLTDTTFKEQFATIADRTITLDALGNVQGALSASRQVPSAHDRNDAAYILYTSGSTGKPKGVVVPHRGVVRLVRDQNYMTFSPELTFLQMGNLCFDASTWEIWSALLNGARLVLQPQHKPTLAEIANTIKQHSVTSAVFSTGIFNMLVDEHLNDLRGMKHIATGGDVMSPTHSRKALRVLGPGLMINVYGPTENSVFATCHVLEDEHEITSTVPIGKPVSNSEVYILDETLKPVPIGEVGELCAGGDGVALGYWRKPDLTNEKFVPDPFSGKPGGLMYRTGDLARWKENGTIEFIGRADNQIKLRGFRIELGEIETAMDGSGVLRDRVVICREDEPGNKQLFAYLVANEKITPDEELIHRVREHLRTAVPDHMIPSAFVVMQNLPLNHSGKVDRKALPKPLITANMRTQHVAPRTDLEKRIAAIWSSKLKVENIGIHDNFFELGGHSLIGIQLLAMVEEEFGRSLPLKALFEASTIAEFSAIMRGDERTTDWENLSLIQSEGGGAPLFCVNGDEANHSIPKLLGATRPFYAFFHQGEDGHAMKYTTVESIATHFIKEMKQAQPRGPYLLLGYSFGGIVAYEMAQQLAAAGDSVPMLGLIDTYSPEMHVAAFESDRKFYTPLKQWISRAIISTILKRGGVIPMRLRNFHIIDTYYRAVLAYTPRPYNGEITMYKASTSWGPPEMGWERLAKGGLRVINVEANHYNIIQAPQVAALVSGLETELARVEAGSIAAER